MKRIVSLILVAIMLTALVACGGDGNDDPATTTAPPAQATETTAPETTAGIPLELPDKNWEGRTFNVLAYDCDYDQFDTFEVFAEGLNGEVVNDAIYKRNSTIEEKYGVKIQATKFESTDRGTNTAPEIRRSTLAQESVYDLVFVTMQAVGSVAREGMFIDLNSVDYINFEKPWWNQDLNDTLEVSDKLLFTTSDFALSDKNRVYTLVYNTDMVKSFNLGDPVQLVRDGKWTMDVVSEWTQAVIGDLNGDQALDIEDRFGIAADSYDAFGALLFGCDTPMMARNADGDLQPAFNTDHTIAAIEKVFSITGDPQLMVYPEVWKGKVAGDHWEVSSNIFATGRALFSTTFPHALKDKSQDCVDGYAIIPWPKFDEAQEKYYAKADKFSQVFAIPTQAKDPNFSGFMLEALSHYSTDTSLHAYYEITCKLKNVYDPVSAEMLDLTFDGIVYDLAMIYNIQGLSTLVYDLAQKEASSFASMYATREKIAAANLKKLAEDLGD